MGIGLDNFPFSHLLLNLPFLLYIAGSPFPPLYPSPPPLYSLLLFPLFPPYRHSHLLYLVFYFVFELELIRIYILPLGISHLVSLESRNFHLRLQTPLISNSMLSLLYLFPFSLSHTPHSYIILLTRKVFLFSEFSFSHLSSPLKFLIPPYYSLLILYFVSPSFLPPTLPLIFLLFAWLVVFP